MPGGLAFFVARPPCGVGAAMAAILLAWRQAAIVQ